VLERVSILLGPVSDREHHNEAVSLILLIGRRENWKEAKFPLGKTQLR
jgi:hypothetical protein